MNISKDDIKQLKDVVRQNYDLDLSLEESQELGSSLIELFEVFKSIENYE